MTDQDIKVAIFSVLRRVAPEVDPALIVPDISLRDQLDVDSMDLLNFVIRLHQDLGVEIPEVDYPKLDTLDHCTAYLQERLAQLA